jgi:hypothetical protein
VDDPNALRMVHEVVESLLTATEAEKLRAAYDLTDASDAESKKKGLLELISDLRFYLPLLKITEGLTGVERISSYRYYFHQVGCAFKRHPNQFDLINIAQPHTRRLSELSCS